MGRVLRHEGRVRLFIAGQAPQAPERMMFVAVKASAGRCPPESCIRVGQTARIKHQPSEFRPTTRCTEQVMKFPVHHASEERSHLGSPKTPIVSKALLES